MPAHSDNHLQKAGPSPVTRGVTRVTKVTGQKKEKEKEKKEEKKKKNCCGRDGKDRIEGSIRVPRGPKKHAVIAHMGQKGQMRQVAGTAQKSRKRLD